MQKVIEISQYELERGKPMPSKLHGYVQLKLGTALENAYGDKFSLFSELSIELSDWDSVPDLAIYPKMELDYSEDEVQLTEPPLCAIEILSPTQSLNELIEKAKRYFRHGVKSSWLVIPAVKNIYVFSGPGSYEIYREGQTLVDAQIGVSLDLNNVFK